MERTITAALGYKGELNVGFPAGNFDRAVYTGGVEDLWAAFSPPEQEDSTKRYWNGFGVFREGAGAQNITVEINIALHVNTARVAGYFAQEPVSGAIYLMHSGKIGGAAQKRLANGGVLHHATLSYDMDGQVMTEVLRIGREKLSDKGTVSAAKRVDPLRSQTGLPREAIIERFVQTFSTLYGAEPGRITEEEYAEAEALVAEKFSTDAWLQRVP